MMLALYPIDLLHDFQCICLYLFEIAVGILLKADQSLFKLFQFLIDFREMLVVVCWEGEAAV